MIDAFVEELDLSGLEFDGVALIVGQAPVRRADDTRNGVQKERRQPEVCADAKQIPSAPASIARFT